MSDIYNKLCAAIDKLYKESPQQPKPITYYCTQNELKYREKIGDIVYIDDEPYLRNGYRVVVINKNCKLY